MADCTQQTVIKLPTDKRTSKLLQSVLAHHGFKWSFHRGTDRCAGGDIVVDVKRDVVTIRYKTQRSGGLRPRGSVFSKSVGQVSRIAVPADLTSCIPFVYLKTPARHFDWHGAEVMD